MYMNNEYDSDRYRTLALRFRQLMSFVQSKYFIVYEKAKSLGKHKKFIIEILIVLIYFSCCIFQVSLSLLYWLLKQTFKHELEDEPQHSGL